jgi:CheY-like chemotaxis protein
MSNAQDSASKETILIVDDIPENLQLLAGMLSEQGLRRAPCTGRTTGSSICTSLPT